MLESTRARLTAGQYDSLVKPAAHPGLWFDRYLQGQPEKRLNENNEPYKRLISNTIEISKKDPYQALYKAFYHRWQALLATMGARTATASTRSRLACGHGRESAIETGVFLHQTYGVPYIPGSSLKGVAAAYAERYLSDLWQPSDDAYKTLFGTPDSAGYIAFLDALPVPGTWRLSPDVITVHHRDYYQSGEAPPADWDSPTPISFLAATGDFLLALLPSNGAEAWADAAHGILKMALEEIGVGGKTNSGYGRLVWKA